MAERLGRGNFAFASGWERRVICIHWSLGRGDGRADMFVLQVAFLKVKQPTLAKVSWGGARAQCSRRQIGPRSANSACCCSCGRLLRTSATGSSTRVGYQTG